ncbi:MAG TPA: hypothetical protein VG297_25865 [Bryobacteraceae bacterium]|nr:hypothetical protein [Bryobacteraceae bacterium]
MKLQVLAALTSVLAFGGAASAQLTISGLNNLTASFTPAGAFSVTFPGVAWQVGGTLGARPSNSIIATGADNIGAYQEIAFDYASGASSRSGSIRAYTNRPLVMFAITYLSGGTNAAPFPVFSTYPQGLFHLAWNGMFAFPEFNALLPDSPWVLFDGGANTLVISPASDYLVAATALGANGEIQAGISSKIPALPAGMTHRTLLAYGPGINQTIDSWGRALTDLAGKQRPANDADTLLNTISYWTDNGATYYYDPGGPSYTDTLRAVKADFDAAGIELGSMQLDSWWYPKGPDNAWSSHGGIWSYSAAPGIFPSDLTGFQTSLGIPLTTHARWLDAASPYRGQYQISGNVATDPQYWEDMAAYLKSSGVTTYEQDWLGLNAQATLNLIDPAAFFDNMAASMAKRGITMQYCMALPEHFLQSTNYSNLTTIRTSGDGFSRARWTEFLYGARLASALGIWPFSDVLMSTDRESLIVAALSAGPVGIGDALGAMSTDNLRRVVRSDGVIVKPDAPLTPLDSTIASDAQSHSISYTATPMIASTFTDFGGVRAQYIFAYTRGADAPITIQPSAFGLTGAAYLYDYLGGIGYTIAANSQLTLNLQNGTGYFVLSPVGESGIVFLGDKDQFVTLGKKRIAALADTGRVDVKVAFAAGEGARTLFGYSPQPVAVVSLRGGVEAPVWDASTQMFSVRVHASIDGTARIRIAPALIAVDGSADPVGCGIRCGATHPVPIGGKSE